MTLKPVRFSYDLTNTRTAVVESICVATKKVTLLTVLVDEDDKGNIITASNVSFKFSRGLDPHRTDETGEAVYWLRFSGSPDVPNSYGIFVKNHIYHYHHTECPLHYLVRGPDFHVRPVWKGLE